MSDGICGGDIPPLIGSTLTGSGLTLPAAAARVARGDDPPLTDVQRRIVERYLEDAEDAQGEHADG